MPPAEHAFLTASGAHRWGPCTASPHFEAQFPDETSPYAEEGTLAHEACEFFARHYFIREVDPFEYELALDDFREDPHWNEEMLTTAKVYTDYLYARSLGFPEKPHVAVEVRVDLSDWIPEGFGTCDSIMIGGDTIHITDYKHGKGVRVDAHDNDQMMLYALGAYKLYAPIYGDRIKRVTMAIVQPRISEEPSESEISIEALLAYGEYIKPIAREAFYGPGEFHPGEHCRFCKGRAQCRARAEQNTALEEFKGIAIPKNPAAPKPDPCLSNAEIGDLLRRGENLVRWYEDLKAYAQLALLAGEDIPGFKIVEGRSVRAFTNVDDAFAHLTENGVNEALLYERKPLTLSQVEKLLGKKQFGVLLADYVVRPHGAPTLVPASDKRPVFNPAAADFAGVEGT